MMWKVVLFLFYFYFFLYFFLKVQFPTDLVSLKGVTIDICWQSVTSKIIVAKSTSSSQLVSRITVKLITTSVNMVLTGGKSSVIYVTHSIETSRKCWWNNFSDLFMLKMLKILSSEVIYHLSYLLKVSPMKSQHFSWKFLCFLLICDMFIGLYLKKCSGYLRLVLWEWVTYSLWLQIRLDH